MTRQFHGGVQPFEYAHPASRIIKESTVLNIELDQIRQGVRFDAGGPLPAPGIDTATGLHKPASTPATASNSKTRAAKARTTGSGKTTNSDWLITSPDQVFLPTAWQMTMMSTRRENETEQGGTVPPRQAGLLDVTQH
jgi:hypothetical protein